MSKRNVNINITKKKTTFIDGPTTKKLTKEEFQERYGKVKPNLQSKGLEGKDNEQDRSDKEEGGDKGNEGEN